MQDKPNASQKQSFLKLAANFAISLKDQALEIRRKLGDLEKTNLELGLFHMQNGHYLDAAFRFKFVLWRNKNNKAANYLLGKAYVYAEKFDKAITPLRAALAQNPKNEEAKFLLTVCGVKLPVERIPLSFIEEQLDSIAPHYELLVAEVHSKINSALKTLFDKHLGKKQDLDVLVLPARGGDVGEILLDRAKKTIGVESSLKLAGQTRTRQPGGKTVFNEVATKAPLDYLKTSKTKFDVIISTFFIAFFGPVGEILDGANKALKKKGLLAISFEQNDGKHDYELSRRNLGFAHSAEYVHELAKRKGFKLLAEKEVKFESGKTEIIMLLGKK